MFTSCLEHPPVVNKECPSPLRWSVKRSSISRAPCRPTSQASAWIRTWPCPWDSRARRARVSSCRTKSWSGLAFALKSGFSGSAGRFSKNARFIPLCRRLTGWMCGWRTATWLSNSTTKCGNPTNSTTMTSGTTWLQLEETEGLFKYPTFTKTKIGPAWS